MSKILKCFFIITLVIFASYALAQTNNASKVAPIPSLHSAAPKTSYHPWRFFSKWMPSKKTTAQQKHDKAKTLPIAYMQRISKSVPSFDKLLVDGNFNVELHSGYSKPSVVIKGNSLDLLAVKAVVQNNTLVLHAEDKIPKFAPINVIIKGRYIHSIQLKANANIKGHALKMSYLDLEVAEKAQAHLGGYLMVHKVIIQDQGTVRLDGVRSKDLEVCLKNNANLRISGKANLTKLDASDHSQFIMTWVDSWNLIAKVSNEAYVQLAGIVNKLDACVSGNAHWNGRYLRSRRTFMKTYGHATARVSAVKKQHTLALDQSNIYFYNLSTYRTDFMAFDGSVLDMRNWQTRAEFDYDHYNKPE
ncbi:DUF2807 domain-containing protein [Legionella sp. W05-934-2]|jgi:hypothetical protein|uniref:GIN domain-containing protein n=1 Tax=Legionella sp. W05-934-2 TaxID=1198649 RepID=UPI0034635C67